MGHASLMDVFQAAAGLGNQALDMYSKYKKEELDAVYYRENLRLRQDLDRVITDFTAPDENGNNAYQDNPDLYAAYVDKTLGQWQDNAIRAGNGSRYYNDLVHRTGLAARTEMAGRIHQIRVNVGKQRADIAWEKAVISTWQDQGMSIGERLNTVLAINDRRGGSPQVKHERDTNAYTEALNRAVTGDLLPTTREDREYLESLRGILPQELKGRDAVIDKAIGDRRNAIQTANKDQWLHDAATFDQLIKESVRGGEVKDWNKYNQAMALRNRWLPVRNGLSGNTEFAESDKDQLAKTFDLPFVKGSAGGTGSGSGKKGKRAPRIQEYWLMRGENGESPEAVMDSYMNDVSDWANDNGMSLDEYLYSQEYLEDTSGFLQEVAKKAIAQYETATGITLQGEKGLIAAAVNDAVKSLKNVPKENIASAANYLTMAVTNAFMDFGNGVFIDDGDNGIAKKIKSIAGAMVVAGVFSGKQPQLKTDEQKVKFIKNLEGFGEDLAMRIRAGISIENRGGRLVLAPGQEVMAGGKAFWNEAYKVLAGDAAVILKIDPGKISYAASRSTEGGDKNELSAMPVFTVAGGTKDASGKDVGGTYRFATKGGKLVLEKDNGEVYTTTANEERSDQKQRQSRETQRLTAIRDLNTAWDELYKTGGSLTDEKKRNFIRLMGKDGPISSVDVIKAGIDPTYFKPISNDPNVQKSYLERVPPGERQQVLASWRELSNRSKRKFIVSQAAMDFVNPRDKRKSGGR